MRGAGTLNSIAAGCIGLGLSITPAALPSAYAQVVDDGSDATFDKKETRTILDLIRANLKDAADAKVTSLRRSRGSLVCGSLNVKNKDGLYLGERGFVADLAARTFGRVPEGPELMDPHAKGFEEKERVRELYFDNCLD